MKKTLFIIIAVIALTACAKKKSFDSVKSGMEKAKVLELVGEPSQKMPMFIVEWWMYEKDNKMIVMSGDTVLNVVMDLKASQDSLKSFSADIEKLSEQMKTTTDSIE